MRSMKMEAMLCIAVILLLFVSGCSGEDDSTDSDGDLEQDVLVDGDTETETPVIDGDQPPVTDGDLDIEDEGGLQTAVYHVYFEIAQEKRYLNGRKTERISATGGFWNWDDYKETIFPESGCAPIGKEVEQDAGLDNGPVAVTGGLLDIELAFDEATGFYKPGSIAGLNKLWGTSNPKLTYTTTDDNPPLGAIAVDAGTPDSISLQSPDPTDISYEFPTDSDLTIRWSTGSRGAVRIWLRDPSKSIGCHIIDGSDSVTIDTSEFTSQDAAELIVERVVHTEKMFDRSGGDFLTVERIVMYLPKPPQVFPDGDGTEAAQ